MSSRVRRMALGLATLTLLMSALFVVRGVVDPPDQALASCRERTWCDPPWQQQTTSCCCSTGRWKVFTLQTCYWQEWDCTINWYTAVVGEDCTGSSCRCIP